ncbi:hypothetical protein DPMN_070710 [Dreissena polymorpha]|uniref:Uncharacterized protein n=1 Tax=Dreissena polymorpha TaxID=45954 RepID=A0A9D3Z1U9_DREPO|nr:hypothetical protein DPMN_070710 [Dreissena polymorpha]
MRACGYDEYRNDNITIAYKRDFDTYKRKADIGHSLITVDEFGKEDQISKQFERFSMWLNASKDTVEKELQWLEDRALQENCLKKVNSGDKIKRERENARENDE